MAIGGARLLRISTELVPVLRRHVCVAHGGATKPAQPGQPPAAERARKMLTVSRVSVSYVSKAVPSRWTRIERDQVSPKVAVGRWPRARRSSSVHVALLTSRSSAAFVAAIADAPVPSGKSAVLLSWIEQLAAAAASGVPLVSALR